MILVYIGIGVIVLNILITTGAWYIRTKIQAKLYGAQLDRLKK